jgi:hypothetical protein
MRRWRALSFPRFHSFSNRIRRSSETRDISTAFARRVEKGGNMDVFAILEIVTALGRIILLAIEIENARRDGDGHLDTS